MAIQGAPIRKSSVQVENEAYHGDSKASSGTPTDVERRTIRGTQLETDEIRELSQAHRDYLQQRHGTLDLDPVPAFDPADPYNWPTWKVRASPQVSIDPYNELTLALENHQLDPRRLPCLHVHFHRGRHHPRLREHCR